MLLHFSETFVHTRMEGVPQVGLLNDNLPSDSTESSDSLSSSDSREISEDSRELTESSDEECKVETGYEESGDSDEGSADCETLEEVEEAVAEMRLEFPYISDLEVKEKEGLVGGEWHTNMLNGDRGPETQTLLDVH